MGMSPLILRSVWDWNEQFSDKDTALFYNTLYDEKYTEILKPKTHVWCMETWTQCYFRWLPILEIRCGGRPQIDLCSQLIATEIHDLQKKINTVVINGHLERSKEECLELLHKVNSFYPFSYNNADISRTLLFSNALLSGDALDSQSIINLNIE